MGKTFLKIERGIFGHGLIEEKFFGLGQNPSISRIKIFVPCI